jgi:hypothetical protein
MLIAKINPGSDITKQITPFSSITTHADYITAFARPYMPGASQTNFEVIFGEAILDDAGTIIGVQRAYSSSITLSAEELAGWGTSDETMLAAVATKIGTTATNFYQIDPNHI